MAVCHAFYDLVADDTDAAVVISWNHKSISRIILLLCFDHLKRSMVGYVRDLRYTYQMHSSMSLSLSMRFRMKNIICIHV